MSSRPQVLVIGNPKGGSGKSTTAMHIAMRLMALGHSVAVLDLDGRQRTLARYMENRTRYARRRALDLTSPAFAVVHEAEGDDQALARARTHKQLSTALGALARDHDFIVVDCPGSDTYLARLGHSFADTLVTPLNDSFIDIDLLADVDPESHAILAPSWYSEMVWSLRKARHHHDQHAIDWLVLHNRTSHQATRNRRHVQKVLGQLAPRIGFRVAQGLGDRVIFRELFLKGLTLSDLRHRDMGVSLTMNHVVAHQEIKDLVQQLRLKRHKPTTPVAASA